jgi:hypothetical protein
MHVICYMIHFYIISGELRELGATLCMGNEFVYREGLHVYAAAGGTRARMSMHVPTADVT